MKLLHLVLISLVLTAIPADSQEIITAERYLEMVSERYGVIRDYEAQVSIRSGNSEMPGNLSYLAPSFLRIDFTRPAEQLILFNGDQLIVYLPEQRAVLNQHITPSRRPAAGLATAQGLSLLRRNYVPSFVTGPDPIPLDPDSPERVVKLRLTRRNISEGFREIILSVNPDTRLIRRIEGRTIADVFVSFDFFNIRTNVGIPELRFLYDASGSAFNFNNFLFRDSE